MRARVVRRRFGRVGRHVEGDCLGRVPLVCALLAGCLAQGGRVRWGGLGGESGVVLPWPALGSRRDRAVLVPVWLNPSAVLVPVWLNPSMAQVPGLCL